MKKSFKPVGSYTKNSQRFSTILQLPVHDHSDVCLTAVGQPRSEIQGNPYEKNRAYKQLQNSVEEYKSTVENRTWIKSRTGITTAEANREKTSFRVMSYNLLAPSLVHHKNLDLYPHVAERDLAWERRSAKIIQEVETIDPDILCLQELDSNEAFISNHLREAGYEGAYKGKRDPKIDGCGIFWNPQKFEQVLTTSLEFNLADQETALLRKEQNALYVALRPKSGDLDHVCLVANTHLLYNSFRGDIKTMQAKMVIEGLRTLKSHFESQGQKVSVIFCGDLNLTPSSALYQYLDKGELNVQGIKRNKLSGQYLACKQEVQPIDQDRLLDSRYYNLVKRFCPEKYSRTSESRPENWFPEVSRAYVTFDKASRQLNISIDSRVDYRPEFEDEYRMMRSVSHEVTQTPRKFRKAMYGCEYDGRLTMQTHPSKAGEDYLLKHDLNLTSSYAQVRREADGSIPDSLTGEPPITHCTSTGMLTTDYIWYSGDDLKVKQIMEMPSFDQYVYELGCPNSTFPSDHFSLATEFSLK
mmetsp:Transcript_24597/g.27991  ORF Transcript_24597/g.27991 Transcript_24597/m.27991 type:complete len:527 (-) Transcript_24597:968-2548(-)|eukprot:CAMPEP_0114999644 /NCGR_PEP_ID=MMETSP0216-20121206/16270_1 /TAXON_ID=223996 /ORGANISM="Protocruzia adherens, Strain Boccale" /LENGTH=526 /DNA_ID=CAMNT_0002364561 /DNA_START=647 /DNA_END=2227 /DNA_ORIENTATION=+